jgi:hypothetical protein
MDEQPALYTAIHGVMRLYGNIQVVGNKVATTFESTEVAPVAAALAAE